MKEPEFEPNQSHALNHCTVLLPIVGAQRMFEWMDKGGFGKEVTAVAFVTFHLFEADIYLAMQ